MLDSRLRGNDGIGGTGTGAREAGGTPALHWLAPKDSNFQKMSLIHSARRVSMRPWSFSTISFSW
jgi:hypothetical protein